MGFRLFIKVRLDALEIVIIITEVEDSMLSSKPHLFPHKLSIWPLLCGAVLTGGMHNDLLLIPGFK